MELAAWITRVLLLWIIAPFLCYMLLLVGWHLAPRSLVRRLRSWPEPPGVDAWSIEQHARFLVQKIARVEAARHALVVYEARPVEVRELVGHVFLMTNLRDAWKHGDRLRARVAEAERLRDEAVIDLRGVLGLPDFPTQTECGIWGEAP